MYARNLMVLNGEPVDTSVLANYRDNQASLQAIFYIIGDIINPWQTTFRIQTNFTAINFY